MNRSPALERHVDSVSQHEWRRVSAQIEEVRVCMHELWSKVARVGSNAKGPPPGTTPQFAAAASCIYDKHDTHGDNAPRTRKDNNAQERKNHVAARAQPMFRKTLLHRRLRGRVATHADGRNDLFANGLGGA